FLNVVAWRKNAEVATKWFAKGRMILVQGELQTRQYTDKSGNPATWYEIIAERLSFTGERKLDADNTMSDLPSEPPRTTSAAAEIYTPEEPAFDDDYPF
ncbi:MAG: single-stranded DNA-binding protein, partial [Ruminococcaceae bacterium]|nr:single-stranded DNA-binding protein [Oscillospiraceae bacterium]